jgi:hypothetical protein
MPLRRRPHSALADVADAAAPTAAMARIRARFPKIGGVLHSVLALQAQATRAMGKAVFARVSTHRTDIPVMR